MPRSDLARAMDDCAVRLQVLKGRKRRGMMAPRGLYIFSHENKLGNAPAHKLFERIKPALKETVTVPRQFSDYIMSVDDADLPSGITLTRLIEG